MSSSVFIHIHCCSTMELKAKSVLLLICVTTIIILTSTEVDAIPKCCLRASKIIPKRMLVSVSKYEIQDKSGICEIDAVILFIRNKWICADLKVLKRLKKLKKNHKPKQTQTKAE